MIKFTLAACLISLSVANHARACLWDAADAAKYHTEVCHPPTQASKSPDGAAGSAITLEEKVRRDQDDQERKDRRTLAIINVIGDLFRKDPYDIQYEGVQDLVAQELANNTGHKTPRDIEEDYEIKNKLKEIVGRKNFGLVKERMAKCGRSDQDCMNKAFSLVYNKATPNQKSDSGEVLASCKDTDYACINREFNKFFGRNSSIK